MDELYLATTPFIVLVVYFATWCLKMWVFKTKESRRALPPVAAAIGCAVALAFFFLAPEQLPFENIVDCCTHGMSSGLAAVGCNQVYKQFKKFQNTDDNDIVNEDVPTIDEVASKNEAADDDRIG